MAAIDQAIIVLYLLALLLLGAALSRSTRDAEAYDVGSRRLPWWALALSTMATQSSANSFIGIPAFVALVPGGGLTWLQYELALPLALLVVMLVFMPVFRELRLISLYEYLELRFDRATRLLLSAVFLVSRALAAGVALYAAGLVVQVCTGWSLAASVLTMGLATLVYDLLGGMKAVVWSDVLQMLLLLAGLLLCIGLAVDVAGGWRATLDAVPAARWTALDTGHGIGDGTRVPLWGFLIGGTVLYVAYYGVDQSQAQRLLSAGNVADARRVLVVNAFGRFPLTLLYALLGVALIAVLAADPVLRAAVPSGRWDQLVPRFIELHVPSGWRGALVAALLAAAMSSLDSALNSLSAATLRDFVAPRVSGARLIVASRACTLFWGLVIVGVGLGAGRLAGNVIEAINQVGALFYGPLLAAFGCGLLARQATGAAVRAGVAAGIGVNLVLWVAFGSALYWMWWNVSGLLVAVAVTWLAARLARAAGGAAVETTDERLMVSGRQLLAGLREQGLLAGALLAWSALLWLVLWGLGWR